MTAAVLVSGQMRTLDVCYPTIERHILMRMLRPRGVFNVYAATAEDGDAHKVVLFPGVLGSTEHQPEQDEKNYQAHIGLGCYGVQVVLKQLWALKRAWEIMESDGEPRPLWVIRLRPDCWFHNDIENLNDCDTSCVYVPTFHNFYGLNDRFAFGGYEAMKVYCNRLDTMDDYIAAGGIFHPESHLKWVMERAGIEVRRTQILFDLVRKNGTHVKPDWNHDADYGDVTTC